MPQAMRNLRSSASLFLFAVASYLIGAQRVVLAQDVPPSSPGAAQPSPTEQLIQRQSAIASRFRRLEELLLRRAELANQADPDRAELLVRAVAESQRLRIAAKFEDIAALIGKDQVQSYQAAKEAQDSLKKDLDKLLELLLSEDRAERIEQERARLKEILAEIGKLLRSQRSVLGETDAGAEFKELIERQSQLAERAASLADRAKAAEDASKGAPEEPNKGSNQESPQKPTENQSPGGRSPGQETPPENPREGPSTPMPGGESPPPGQPSPSPSQPADDQSPPPNQKPGENRLQSAQQRMKQAQRKLEESQRGGAAEEQTQAIRELEEAKAELERILRQLREEEVTRTLALLEPRLRRMLEMQTQVYEATKRLAPVAQSSPRDAAIEAGGLAKKEQEIQRDADRALSLLRDEGSAVAFPEALTVARDDMAQIAARLADSKLDSMTIGMEEDVLAALEEMLSAIKEAERNLQQRQQNPQQQQPQDGGEPEDEPLVQKIQELKMIRALQLRVNRRTAEYTEKIKGEEATDRDLADAIARLAERQARIYETTRNIVAEEAKQ